MLTPFLQFSFLCVVALANLCLGFAIASRLGFGPSLGVLFQLETAAPELLLESVDRETTSAVAEEPVAGEAPDAEIDTVVSDESIAVDDSTVVDESTAADESTADDPAPSHDELVHHTPEA